MNGTIAWFLVKQDTQTRASGLNRKDGGVGRREPSGPGGVRMEVLGLTRAGGWEIQRRWGRSPGESRGSDRRRSGDDPPLWT